MVFQILQFLLNSFLSVFSLLQQEQGQELQLCGIVLLHIKLFLSAFVETTLS